MRYCIFSDVHGNIEALEAFFESVRDEKDLNFTFLGDAIGYGPNPNECIELIREHTPLILLGNHDQAVLDDVDISNFNPYARKAIIWTRSALKSEHKEFIQSLKYEAINERITFVHATPFQPDRWHYLFTRYDAQFNFHCFSTQICFIGHSHQPMTIVFSENDKDLFVSTEPRIVIEPQKRYIINDGSIGQPRDGNNRACYLIFDDEANTIDFRRVEYDYKQTQSKMSRYGLPDYLIERLEYGR